MKMYTLPAFLMGVVTEENYKKWLVQKSRAHVKRDKVKNPSITTAMYKKWIHSAVLRSNGYDEYTGETLDWHLISTYDNEKSKIGGRGYKQSFANLPTVDHEQSRVVDGEMNFKICSWKLNDCKSDLTLDEFTELCIMFISKQKPNLLR